MHVWTSITPTWLNITMLDLEGRLAFLLKNDNHFLLYSLTHPGEQSEKLAVLEMIPSDPGLNS